MMHDKLSNLIANINGGYCLHQIKTKGPYSRFNIKLLLKLEVLGIIKSFTVRYNINDILINLYVKKPYYILKKKTFIKKRVYLNVKQIKNFIKKNKTNGYLIISTSRGLMIDNEAIANNQGGEFILQIN